MCRNRRHANLCGFLLVLSGLAAMLLARPAFGQAKARQTPQIIEVAIEGEKDKGAPVKEVDLRPNTPTELDFEVKNNAGEILGDVTLKIVQVVDGQDRVIAETKIKKLEQTADAARGLLVQMFDKIKGAPEKLELAGAPPFKLQVQVQAKNLPLLKRELKLVIREPQDYVAATAKFSPADSVLRVEVEIKGEKSLIGPHLMPVQLMLGPDVRPTKKGIFKQTLTGPKQKLSLVAEEVAFERMLTEGDVYLKVDGYERAFTYQVKETAGGAIEPRPVGEIRVRIGVPRYARPSAKFEVPLEIDGPLSGDYKLQVGLDRTGDTEEIPASDVQEFDGLRQQKVTLSVSPAGKLICQADVRDWRAQFDTSDIFGRNIVFRVGVVKDGKKVKLRVGPESRPLVARTETDDREKEVKSVFALVTLDESAPEAIKLELPKDKEWVVGTPFEVRARIRERQPTQAPIARAIVFRGKAPKDDKEEVKAEDILAEGVPDPKSKDWTFKLPAHEKPEPFTLSVQFTTLTGAKATLSDTISFKVGAAAGKKSYKIKGTVVRGELGQPGMAVTLMDAKRKVKATVKTGDDGAFVFENVEPGAYIVASMESFRGLAGETKPFDVPAKDNKEIHVTVSLLAK